MAAGTSIFRTRSFNNVEELVQNQTGYVNDGLGFGDSSVCWRSYLLDFTAVVGAVGDSVAGDVHGSGRPAHPQHAVGDHGELNTQWLGERDCGEGRGRGRKGK